MFNASILDTRFFGAPREPLLLNQLQRLPVVIVLNVGDAISFLRDLEEECGRLFDEQPLFEKLLELLGDEQTAIGRVADYVDHQTYGRFGLGVCAETQEYLRCFSWLAMLLLHQLRQERLYQHGRLVYAMDHMRSSSLILRRLDSVYDLIRRELSTCGT